MSGCNVPERRSKTIVITSQHQTWAPEAAHSPPPARTKSILERSQFTLASWEE